MLQLTNTKFIQSNSLRMFSVMVLMVSCVVVLNKYTYLITNVIKPTEYIQMNYGAFVAHEPEGLAPCGEVCTYGGTVVQDAAYPWPQLHKHINCEDMMKRMSFRGHPATLMPPRYPPDYMLEEFTMFGDMPITRQQFHVENWTAKAKYFTQHHIRDIINTMNKGVNVNIYKDGICVQHTLRRYVNKIEGKRGFVVGTDLPWLEGILLGYGARNVTTLEYAELHFESPELEAYTPYDFADKWLRGDAETYDFGATFSSIEHSGLGRYTDPLNPYGDLESMAQSWCMLKPGGLFAVGVEDSLNDSDYIVWNAHRVSGPKRLAQLAANWKVIEKALCADEFNHNFIILQKPA